MIKIQKPLAFPELNTKPEITGMPDLSEDIQQTMALLTAFDGVVRRLLRCSVSGILQTTSPRTRPTIKHTSSGADETWSPDSQVCSECIVRADSANSGDIYVQLDIPATVALAWPLDANEWVIVHPDDLHNLSIFTVTSSDKVIIFPSE